MNLARRQTLAGLALAGLASPARADTTPAPAREVTIAFVPIFGSDPFYMTMDRGARAAAKAVGATLIYQGPTEPSPVQQLQALNAAVARKPDVLLVAPADRTLMIAPLRKAAVELGIPVICVDTYIGANDGNYQTGRGPVDFPLSYIASDDTAGGALAARAMAKATGGAGPVYISSTSPDVATLTRRDLGFRAEMSRLLPDVTVLPTQYTNMDPAKAATQLRDMLAKAPTLAGVYCSNPGAAIGTTNALQQAGRSGAIKVVVVDATEQMVAALKAGLVDIIVSQHPAEMGWLATMLGFGVATGQSIPPRVETGFTALDRGNIGEPGMKRFIYAR